MGTPYFAVPSLQALIDQGENVVAVVTQPDRPKGRGRKLCPPPIKELAEKYAIPVLQPVKVRTQEFINELRSFSADLFLVTAYGRILTEGVLAIPPMGCINVHGSLLPKYRGAAPVQWSILNGDSEAGVTIMQMDAGMDTGDILLPGKIAIEPDDTSATLAVKLASLGGQLLTEALSRLRANNLPPMKQDESKVTMAPLLRKEDSTIDWHKSARQISCQIRGLDPWPLASTTLREKRLRLFLPQVLEGSGQASPGTIIKADKNGILVSTGKESLLIKEVQKDGSKRMSAASYLQGNTLEVGERFA